MKRFYIILLLMSLSGGAASAQSGENKYAMKEFIRSCTFGVLAGTLVGAATLAFTDQPGENLNRVARGASLGLYAGIALGVYVVYIVPNQVEDEPNLDIYEQPGYDTQEESQWRFNAFPLISERGVEGAALTLGISAF